MKELADAVHGTLGLFVAGVVVISLAGGILNLIRVFFAERREARFGDYLRSDESAAGRQQTSGSESDKLNRDH